MCNDAIPISDLLIIVDCLCFDRYKIDYSPPRLGTNQALDPRSISAHDRTGFARIVFATGVIAHT